MDWIFEPWPWYISGPLITLVMTLLLLMEKQFGMSSNLRTLCAICGAGERTSFFKFDWKAQRWNLIVVLGVMIGGYIGANFLTKKSAVIVDDDVASSLNELGFKSVNQSYLPEELFPIDVVADFKIVLLLIIGGLLVGFGTRYAGGCTSGHAISGLSNLQLPSLIAVIGFFIGGLTMVHFIFPIIF
ncbi:MAG: YeeE/YedE family protein [Flavobacteriales bacterium]|nr:YeeE/YedE family protein [Flavobacteriales bacterium]